MQTWAKRGLQTALVTGGMLMLGTGIASADEKVDPDTPAGPLDLSVSVPVQIDDNAVGTPFGQANLPGADTEISTKPVTDAVNKAAAPVTEKVAEKTAPAADAAAPVTEPVQEQAEKVTGAVSEAKETAQQAVQKTGPQAIADKQAEKQASTEDVTPPSLEPSDDPLMGNKVDGNLALPIQITGNAIGLLGDAEVSSDHEQSYEHNSDVSTDGAGGGLAGNVVALDWALPVQISGNAGSLFGSAKSTGSASQEATTTGDVETDGTNGAGAGNVIAPQFATPVQLSGNAIAWFVGHSETDFDASSSADSGGFIATDGEKGAATGNVVGAPVALPVRVANDAVTWGGDADATGSSEVAANSGDTSPGMHDIDSYIQTTGQNGFLAGTIAQPQIASMASVTGTAAAWIGNAVTGETPDRQAGGTTSDATMTAGGASNTNGNEAAGAGNIVDAPVALPVEVFGVGGTWIGNAHAEDHVNSTEAVAGGDTLTPGDESVVSSNTVAPAIASTAEVFGVGGTWIGNASGEADSDKLVQAGGYNGTLADQAAGSGNLVQVPLAAPAEVFGVGGSWIGQGVGEGEESKEVLAGGGGNTEDDYGFVNANLVQAPVSLPAQVFGVGGSWIGNGIGEGTTDTVSEAGGDVNANGDKGTGAGNVGVVPVSLPTQVHGVGGSWIGNGAGTSANLTDSIAGGDATASGEQGSVAGNIVQAPVGAAAGVFGVGANWVGTGNGQSVNDVVTEAGGDAETIGDGGSIAGNVVSAQALPVAQVFGDAASLVGVANGAGANVTDASSGGDIETSGVEGAISGTIIDVPAAAVPQVFGFAPSVGGVANAIADNTTTGEVGGDTTTEGNTNALSGVDGQLPVGAVAQVYDLPLELIAEATSMTQNTTDVSVAEQEPQINLPIDGSEMPVTELPKTPYVEAAIDRVQELSAASPMQRSASAMPTPFPLNMLPQVQGAGMPELPADPTALPTSLPADMPAALPTELPAGELPMDPTAGAFQGVLDGVSLNGVSLGGMNRQATLSEGMPSFDGVPSVDADSVQGAMQGTLDDLTLNGHGLGTLV